MTRRLLNLLGKLLKEIRKMEREHGGGELLTVKEKIGGDACYAGSDNRDFCKEN